MKKTITIAFCLSLLLAAHSQQRPDIQSYVQQYKDIAIREMLRTGIPASVTLAQGILESGCGKSPLAVKANNHFGIKCKTEWTGDKFYMDDDAPQECFRVYTSAELSYADHSEFLTTRPRYAPLFQFPSTDYKSWAHGLKEAGYATNPKYPTMLISYIETNNLHQYDQQAIAMREKKKEKDFVEPVREPATPIRNTSKTDAIVIQDALKPEADKKQEREEFIINGVRALKAAGVENPFTIAFNYGIDYVHILAFNDLTPGESFKDGEYIYLQTKKSKGTEETYLVNRGESMHDIAQKTGLKQKELYAKNRINANEQPYAGERLNLQTKRNSAPRTMSYTEFLRERTKIEAAEQAKKETVKTTNTTVATTPIGNTNSAEPKAITKVETQKPVYSNASASLSETPDVNVHTNTPANNYASNSISNTTHYQVQQKDTLYSIARKFNTTVEKLKEINALASNTLRPGQKLVVAQ